MTPFHRLCALAIAGASLHAAAADWSDTSIGVRHGSSFREPYIADPIAKTIVDVQHADGYAYGANFFNVDLLMSDSRDPASPGSTTGAQEAYVVYRTFLDAGKVLRRDFKAGPVRGWGLTAGFDWNTKNDAGYNSRKRMWVLGPTVSFDVPGFLDVGVHELWESNAPYNDYTQSGVPRYHYKAHPMLASSWGLGIGALPLAFEGYAEYITAKGKDEFGAQTAPETHVDAELMWNAGELVGAKPKTWRLGVEYEFWKNKFGNDWHGPAGHGAFAHTPMVRGEVHF
ncbi:MAG: outer envelope protein [Burkholderiaceae bacterium]